MSIAFRLFGVPVRIHLWFWLMALVIRPDPAGGPLFLLIWLAVVFQGILMHEFGHALVGRRFGRDPNIELIALGGLTWWRQATPLSPWRSIAVSFAGPAVGIAIGLIAFLVQLDVAPADGTLLHYVLMSLVWVNLGWGLLNLLPLLPLDGGNIAASVLEMFFPGRGRLGACYLSFLLIGALIAMIGAMGWNPILIMLLLFFGFSTYQIYRGEKDRLPGKVGEPGSPSSEALGRDALVAESFEALERGDGPRVIELASVMVRDAETVRQRDESFHLLAWGKLLHGDPAEAREALRSMSAESRPDPALEGAVFVELGETSEAIPLLEKACERGGTFAEAYLLRAVQAEQAWDHVIELARSFVQKGKPRDAMRWLLRARDAGFRDGASLDRDRAFADVRALPEWPEFRASLDTKAL